MIQAGWGSRNGGRKIFNFFQEKVYIFPVPPLNHDFRFFRPTPKSPPTFGCTARRKMVKNQKIKKISKSSENFRNFCGSFVRIGSLATEHELFENRAKPPKIMIFRRFRPKIRPAENRHRHFRRKIESGMPRHPKQNLTMFL